MHLTRRSLGRLALAVGAKSTPLFAANGASAIDTVLRSRIDSGKIPAVAAIAGTDTAITYSGAFGKRDAESAIPLAPDSIFRIASMTKAITAVAAMQLVEQGKLNLDDPAARHVPELEKLQVLTGFDGSGKPVLRAPAKPVTLRQLLTHTSGFVYDDWDVAMHRFDAGHRDDTYILAFDPGAKWQYGPGPMWAGRMVEAVSGLNLEQYFQRNILDPLGMKDTTFVFPKEKFGRLTGTYQREPNGSLKPNRRNLPKPATKFEGDGGLFSTAPDYLKFTQMILRGGAAPSARILQAKTVAQISENATGNMPAGRLKSADPAISADVDFHPGHDDRYTLAFLMNPDAYPGRRSAGSLAWAGINNTYYWIDPNRKLTGVVMMQFLPFADKEAVRLLEDFERAVYAAWQR